MKRKGILFGTASTLGLVLSLLNYQLIWNLLSRFLASSMEGQEVFVVLPLFFSLFALLGLEVFRFFGGLIVFGLRQIKKNGGR